ASRFDIEKLSWVNHQHMLSSDLGRLATSISPYLPRSVSKTDSRLKRILELQRERSKNLVDLAEATKYFFHAPDEYQANHSRKFLTEKTKPILEQIMEELENLSHWTIELLEGAIAKVCEDRGLGMGRVAQPLRVALTGSTASPSIGETLFLIGREGVIQRLVEALRFIDAGTEAN
ncbi:MAG: glutamate--tRNA ligase, partial [Pseudomonadota bacterium]|nr:glutamate--tRNA ligase [Pseudomonadota bacterium]